MTCRLQYRRLKIDTICEQATGRSYPIPKSSIRSNGVPHRRQIKEAQSPQARGSLTGWRH
jgi:hypothetical protein